MLPPIRFLGCILQHAFGFGGEWNLDRRGHFLVKRHPAPDFVAEGVTRNPGIGKQPAGDSFPFANEPEQQVFGSDGEAAELARLIPSKEERPAGEFGVALEHPQPL